MVGDTTCDLDQATDREGESEQGYAESGSDGGVFNFAHRIPGVHGRTGTSTPLSRARR